MWSIFLNGTTLLFATLIVGNILGEIRIRNFSVGSGMVLFTGIFLSYFSLKAANGIGPDSAYYKAAETLIASNIITDKVSDIFLMLFICSVGLLTGPKLMPVLKKYGIKFVVVAMVITTVGASGTILSTKILTNIHPREVAGTYTGALTSTTGLSASLEAAANSAEKKFENFQELDEKKQAEIIAIVGEPDAKGKFTLEQMNAYKLSAQKQIGVGHTIAYPFGVMIIMLCITLIPKVFHIDLEKEAEAYERDFGGIEKRKASTEHGLKEAFFNMNAFFLVLLLGCVLGQIRIPLPLIGEIFLGSTGGVLIMSLLLSAKGTLFGFNFRMNEKSLNIIKDIGVSFVLAVTGLRYGYAVVEALSGSGLYLAISGMTIGFMALMAGFLLGRYVFKINWFLLSGTICGGMTSTPGLGVAINSTKSDLPTFGYGAAYPFATIIKVVYTIILESLID